jgi:hypothetical protein
MTIHEPSDLHKRVERYENALEELRSAQQDIKNILHDQILYERWQQLGADLGFVIVPSAAAQPAVAVTQPELNGHPAAEMAEAWAG